MREIGGTVVKGLGEGSYYIKKYSSQIKKATGSEPYPGTLNLKASQVEMDWIRSNNGIGVCGFENGERSYGEIKLIECRVQEHYCWVVVPERGHYRDVVELISPLDLREELAISDGDELMVQFSDGAVRGERKV